MRQSSRMFYKGHDHVDAFFNDKYHEAMAIDNEDCHGVVWYKIHDEKCYILNGSYNIPLYIYYPEKGLIFAYKYLGANTGELTHIENPVCWFTNGYMSSYGLGFLLTSSDGKRYKKIPIENTYYNHVLWDEDMQGFLAFNYIDHYRYYKYEDGEWKYTVYQTGKSAAGGFTAVVETDFTLGYILADGSLFDREGNVYPVEFRVTLTNPYGVSREFVVPGNGMEQQLFQMGDDLFAVFKAQYYSDYWLVVVKMNEDKTWSKVTDFYGFATYHGMNKFDDKIYLSCAVDGKYVLYDSEDGIHWNKINIPKVLKIPIRPNKKGYDTLVIPMTTEIPELEEGEILPHHYWYGTSNFWYEDLNKAFCTENQKLQQSKAIYKRVLDSQNRGMTLFFEDVDDLTKSIAWYDDEMISGYERLREL